jgi:methionyl-tRNA formyltransferase/RimJ/RimL family protein N-acetyltransferase
MLRLLIFGDGLGIPQLLQHIPRRVIAGLVGASIRPQCINSLQQSAEEIEVPLLIQPKWKSTDYKKFRNEVARLKVDLLLINSYSMIIREDVQALSRLGGINVHCALLPKNRGCNPIQWAILKGDNTVGVTLHEIDNGIDTGSIIDQLSVPLFFEDTWIDVRDRLNTVTDRLISKNVEKILSGKWNATPQQDQLATVGRRRTPEDGLFSWDEPIVSIYNKVRALLPPLPPAFYHDVDGKKCYITEYMTIWQIALQKQVEMCGGGYMESDRVRLRPMRKEDSAHLYEWINSRDPVVLNAPYRPISDMEHEVWVETMINKRSDLVIFIIEDLVTDRAIGSCQLFNINSIHRSAELQIRIGLDAYQGKGLGTEAVRLLCQFGFLDLNLHRIYLHVFSSNKRAIRSYEKCGFEREGILKESAFIDGHWVDMYLMALLRK